MESSRAFRTPIHAATLVQTEVVDQRYGLTLPLEHLVFVTVDVQGITSGATQALRWPRPIEAGE